MRIKTLYTFLMAVLVILVYAGCTKGSAEPSTQQPLQELVVFGDKAGEGIMRIGEMATDAEGNLYATDPDGYSLNKYAPTGRLLGRVGQRGDGPGEFNGTIKGVAVADDTVMVVEGKGRTIHSFTTALEYIQSTNLIDGDARLTLVEHVPSGDLYVNARTFEHSQKLMRFDRNLTYRSSPPLKHARGLLMWDMFKFAIGPRGHVVAAYAYMKHIEVISPTDSTLASFEVEQGLPGPELPPAKERSVEEQINLLKEGPRKYFAWDVAVDPSERIYILAGDYAENPQRDVYVYDYAGNYLTTILLPEASKRLHIDRQGHFYIAVATDDKTVIKKYKLNVASS